jgi:iron-sulfur cluster insertion protein
VLVGLKAHETSSGTELAWWLFPTSALYYLALNRRNTMSAVAENIQTEMPEPIVFTDSAAAKVADLIAEEGNPDLKLRVFVQGGGCSGFQYGFTFDEITNEDDTTMSKNGVSLLIDAMSYQYLIGAEIDYKEDLQGAQFVIKNPNATSTCGCGSSFST